MMEITRDNYEAFFIDYMEGNLDESLVDNFIEFLQQNPDLKEELSLFESVSVEAETIAFTKKEKLYKHRFDAENEFNQAAIANLEGDLNEKEKVEFDSYVSAHPEKKKDLTLFAHTKLVADKTIVFGKKNKLYHYSMSRTIYTWSGRIAAILILAFAVFSLFDSTSEKNIPENTYVKAEKKTTEKPVIIEETQELQKPEVETPEKNPVKTKKETPKQEIKKAIPENKSNKRLRENAKGRIEQESLAQVRTPVIVPLPLKPIEAGFSVSQPLIALGKIHYQNPETPEVLEDERLLADVVIEKTGLNNLKFNKLTQAGLNLVSNFTKNNFTYETNNEGKVVEYNYDSRLLAFSIPAKNDAGTE